MALPVFNRNLRQSLRKDQRTAILGSARLQSKSKTKFAHRNWNWTLRICPSSIEIEDKVCSKIKGIEFLALPVFNRNRRQSLHTETETRHLDSVSSIEIEDKICSIIKGLEFLAMSVFNRNRKQSSNTEIDI